MAQRSPVTTNTPSPITPSPAPASPRFRIGSLRCRVASDPHGYAHLLTDKYRATIELGDDEMNSGELVFEFCESTQGSHEETDRLTIDRTADGHRFITDPVTVELVNRPEHRGRPAHHRLRFTVTDPAFDRELLGFHFWIVVNRALLLLDRVMLHAAAFVVDERVIVLCGHNGAGKSTLSVAFGLRGATLLAEDAVMVERRSSTFVVSGVSPQMRVPRPTEDYLLPGRLLDLRISEDGREKRLVDARQLFRSRWGQDFSPHRIVFLRAGDRLSTRPMSSRDSLLGLIANTRPSYRFGSSDDISDHLDLLAAFAASVPAFEATRTTSLDDLDDLMDRLSAV